MADVNVSFGLDARELFDALKNVNTATAQTLNKLEQDAKKLGDSLVTNMAKGTGGISQSKRELTGFIDENKKALVAMQLNGESGTKAYKLIEEQVKKAQLEVGKIDDAAKKVDASLSGIGDGGAATGKLGGLFDSLTSKVPGLGGAVGNLGGSFQQLAGGVTGLVPGLGSLTGVLAGGGITAGIAAVGAGVAYSIEKGKEFETQLASLSSITGVSGAGLEDLGEKAKTMAAKFGTDASANIDAFKTILSKLGPDIAKSPEALNSMAESVNTLSKATGDDPGKATEALTGALLQFGVSLDDPVKAADAMAVAMNVLAAGAKEGASEVPDVAAAINVAGVAASKSKVSFEETNSAIQILAAGGKVGAEAGTSLRNVLNKLGEGRFLPKDTAKELEKAGVDINKLGDTSITFSERLRELNKISADAALTTKLFGTDAAAASILIKGANGEIAGGMDQLTQKLTGTNTAYDQAAINMNTFDESLNRVKANVDNFAIGFYQAMQTSFGMLAEATGPAINEMFTNIGAQLQNMWGIVEPILAALGAILINGISYAINITAETINVFFELATYAFDGVMNALKPLYDAIMSALGLDGAAGEGIDVMKILQDVMNTAGTVISALFDIIAEFGKIVIDFIVGSISNAVKIIVRIGELFVEFGKWIGDLILKIPGVRSVFEGLKSAFDTVYNFFANLPSVINEVQIYLKAVGGTFRSVFNILKESFDAALNLDFGTAAEKLGSVFQSQTWAQAFNNNLQAARNELKATGEAAKKTGKELSEFQSKTGGGTPPPGGDDDDEKKEKNKTAKTITEFQKRKAAYDQFVTEIENARNTEFANFTEQQKAESDTYQNRLKTDASKLNEYLNKQFQAQETTQFIETPVVIKPTGENESATNIQKFYVDTFLKNKNVVDKIAADQLKDQLKVEAELRKQQVAEAEKQYKDLAEIIGTDIKQSTAALATAIPNIGAITQTQYADATKTAEGFVETLRIKSKFIEEQLVSAQIAGADKAAESLQKQLEANNSLLDSAENRLNAYVDASAVTLQNNTLANVAALAVQKGLYDVFLNDKTKAEREQLEKAREEKLNALRQEEDDLETSLANREISFDEYQQKVGAIAEKRREAEAEGEQRLNAILANLKRAGETALGEIAKTESAKLITTATEKQNKITTAETELAAAQRALNRTKKTDEAAYLKAQEDVAEKTKQLADVDAQTYGFRTAVLEEFAGKAIEQFGALAASGTATLADAGKLALSLVVDLLKKQIPVWVASIFGTTVGQLGPFGILVAGGLTATLYALANEAMAGFKTGGYTGDSGTDEVAGVVHGQEYVLNADATRQNRDVLEWANRTNRPIAEYFRAQTFERKTYSVNDNGQLVFEVQKLREETRNLGVNIRRNTTVEIHGSLTGDGRSINAIIENNKRKSIRRG
jgi:TP901 family phage tail tape measure protein